MTGQYKAPFSRPWVRAIVVAVVFSSSGHPSPGLAQIPAAEPTRPEEPVPTAADVETWLIEAYSGDPRAQYKVGVVFARGLGVQINLVAAADWFEKSAQQGFAPAQYNLADAYLRGAGVEQNYELAVKFWRLAAESGLIQAQTNLGRAYYHGLGTDRDMQQAKLWLDKAARSGDDAAAELLAKIRSEPAAEEPSSLPADVAWVFSKYVNGEGSSAKITGSGVRARTQPDTGARSAIVGTLENGMPVTVIRREGEWALVRIGESE